MVEKIAELRLGELLGYCAIVVAVLSTFLEVSKIKINPWSALGRAIGKALNGDVMNKIDDLERRFDKHEYDREKDKADECRANILRFNREILRELPHTREDFIEVLSYIDFYEDYCRDHPEYENNRAVLAIQNIKRVYSERLEKHDFI